MADPQWAVIATQTVAQEAASSMLPRGSAVDAVIAGVFAASAVSKTVFLGPVQILLGGAGMGLLAVDGRLRQPGLSVQRPRGFVTAEEIPPAAYVAVPSLVAALAATRAMANSSTLNQVLAPAIDLAKHASKERHQLFQQIARRGPLALTEEPFSTELIAAAGRLAGGVLTLTDLQEMRPEVIACGIEQKGDHRVATVPWRDREVASARVELVAAADGHGRVAIACYEAPEEGVPIPALDLFAPLAAAPVRRGETRVRPGEPRPASAPMALLESAGMIEIALGFAHSATAEELLSAVVATFMSGTSAEQSVTESSLRGSAPIGVFRTRTRCRAFK